MPEPRLISAEILQSVLEDKVFFAELKNRIAQENRAFANALILGTLRNLLPLKKILNGYLKKKIPHKHRAVQYLLLSAIYELTQMKTPPYAVINATVKNVRLKSDKFTAGMANAVLRNICANPSEAQSIILNENKLPEEFKTILQGYTKEQIQKISDCVCLPAPTDLSAKENPQDLAEKLNALILPNGTLRLKETQKTEQIFGFNEGKWWVQDVAASLPAMLCGDLTGRHVADLCAAPGGKTAQLALKAEKVYAFDISASRLERLKENLLRLNLIDNVEIINADAAEYLNNHTELKFDTILLDAPCSATGTFRRHPEVLHIKTKEDVKTQTVAQKRLLDAAANSLKIGGNLIYSVCSIAKAEGEEQISAFLNRHHDFKIVTVKKEEISVFGKWSNDLVVDGKIRTLPYYEQNIGGMDAFFICKLQKIN